jgi:hypothetical protein
MIFIFLLRADPKCNGPVLHPFLALRASWVYRAMMAVVAWADNLAQALDALNSQFGMGIFKMGWISKTTMQELDGVQAVLQLHHEPFIFVQGTSLTSSPLIIACWICHATTPLIAMAQRDDKKAKDVVREA